MKKFDFFVNMPLNLKFAITFAGLLLVSVVLTVMSIRNINYQVNTAKTVFDGSLVPISYLAETMVNFDDLVNEIRNIAQAETYLRADISEAKMKISLVAFDELMQKYIDTIPSNPSTEGTKNKIISELIQYKDSLLKNVPEFSKGTREADQKTSISLYEQDIKPTLEKISSSIELLIHLSMADAKELGDNMDKARDKAIISISIALAVGAAISLTICLLLRYLVILAQSNLQKSYNDTAAILNEIPTPICVVGKKGGILLDANLAFIKMCDAKSKAVILETSIKTYLNTKNHNINIMEHLQSGLSFKCAIKSCTDNPVEIEVYSKPFVFNKHEAYAVCCIDMTQQKLQEQVLQSTATAAEEASKMKSVFLANMSHEIRTPLNGILGFTELALDDEKLPDNIKGYLSKIKISADSLLRIINNVLDISKIEAGKIELETVPFDLQNLFDRCQTISATKAAENGVLLFVYAEPCDRKKLLGDPTKLQQVLINLLSNAIKFTQKGIVKLMSEVLQSNSESVKIRFIVKDGGIGMTKEQIDKIFSPFVQADISTARKYGGTGLGLSITKGIIELMGGKLEVESSPGVGSKFYFDLDFKTVDEYEEYKENTVIMKDQIKMRPIFDGNVLVCEDNEINQQVIKEHLSRIGLRTVIADNGQQGVEIVSALAKDGKSFDLIFMDIHMPIMDGMEATKKIIGLGVKTPIIALTANVIAKNKEIYLEQGMSGFLAKPFNTSDLGTCLLKYLEPKETIMITNTSHTTGGSLFLNESTGAIDKSIGLEMALGDEKLYIHLLTDFYKSSKLVVATIKEALISKDIKLAHRLVHTLKGTAAAIGAVSLSNVVCELEMILSKLQYRATVGSYYQPNGNSGVSPYMLQLLESELNAVLIQIEPFIPTEQQEVKQYSLEDLDSDSVLKLIRLLKPLLREGNTDSIRLFEQSRSILLPLGNIYHKLESEIENYDFELAYETLIQMEGLLLKQNSYQLI